MKNFKVRLTGIEAILGTNPGDKEMFERWIASHAADAKKMEEEVEEFGVEGVVEKGMTFFNRTFDGDPFLYDYQIKGFFKGSCGFLRSVSGTESSKLKAYKKKLDGLLFIMERKVVINTDAEIGMCQRPLRAQTMQGERVALACSEEIAEGWTMEFTICILDDSMEKLVFELLDYGKLSGIGQWRNSGKGRFDYEVIAS